MNHYWRTTCKGRYQRTYLSSKGKAFRRQAMLRECRTSRELPITEQVDVDLVLSPGKGDIRGDLDNRIKPVLDCLEHNGIVQNDKQVQRLRVEFGPRLQNAGACMVRIYDHEKE